MILRLIGKSILITSLFAAATIAYAKDDDRVLCPAPSNVQRGAIEINGAFKDNETMLYFASSRMPAFYDGNLWWYVGVDRIFANSVDEAIKIGRKRAQKASYQRNRYAFQGVDGLTCFYGPGEIQAVVLKV